jgi:ureidoglycolate lyase
MSPVRELWPETLTARAFAEFGDVVAADGAFELINGGTTRQYADLATIDAAGGRPRVCIYRTMPAALPMPIRMLERHPLSSQCFMPLARQSFVVVVAPPGDAVDPDSIRAFLTGGDQGVNYRRGIWHHPLIALRDPGDFLVIDRAGDGANCDEFPFDPRRIVLQMPAGVSPA